MSNVQYVFSCLKNIFHVVTGDMRVFSPWHCDSELMYKDSSMSWSLQESFQQNTYECVCVLLGMLEMNISSEHQIP